MNIVRAIVVAVALGAGLSAVAPVAAHADDIDQIFLQTLQEKGVSVKEGVDAVAIAHSTCDALGRGDAPEKVLQQVKKSTRLSNKDTTTFAGLAIYGYCKDLMPK